MLLSWAEVYVTCLDYILCSYPPTCLSSTKQKGLLRQKTLNLLGSTYFDPACRTDIKNANHYNLIICQVTLLTLILLGAHVALRTEGFSITAFYFSLCSKCKCKQLLIPISRFFLVTSAAVFSQIFLGCCRGQSDYINVHINKGSLSDSVFLSLWKRS